MRRDREGSGSVREREEEEEELVGNEVENDVDTVEIERTTHRDVGRFEIALGGHEVPDAGTV